MDIQKSKKLHSQKNVPHFYQAYRRLNVFLLCCSICPFLQNKQTNRFVCRRKYLLLVCATTVIYFGFVTWLSAYRLPKLALRLTSMVRILKFYRTIGNVSILLLLIILVLLRRNAHAGFFNKLYHFDYTYNKLIKPPMQYATINRSFWIEITLFSIYMACVFTIEVNFNENMKNIFNLIFWSCELGEQIVFAFVVFHIKNCVCNLLTRIERTNRLLETLGKNSINESGETMCQRFEYITHLYDILFKAREW